MDSVLYSTLATLVVVMVAGVIALAVGYVRYRQIKPGQFRVGSVNRSGTPVDTCELAKCRNTYAWEADTPVTPDMLTGSAKFPRESRPGGFDDVITSMARKST